MVFRNSRAQQLDPEPLGLIRVLLLQRDRARRGVPLHSRDQRGGTRQRHVLQLPVAARRRVEGETRAPPQPQRRRRILESESLCCRCAVWTHFRRRSEERWLCRRDRGHREGRFDRPRPERVPHRPGLQGAGGNELPVQHTAMFQVLMMIQTFNTFLFSVLTRAKVF